MREIISLNRETDDLKKVEENLNEIFNAMQAKMEAILTPDEYRAIYYSFQKVRGKHFGVDKSLEVLSRLVGSMEYFKTLSNFGRENMNLFQQIIRKEKKEEERLA